MKTWWIALKLFLFMIVLTGVVYPLVITAIAAAVFPGQAHGSLVVDAQGTIKGSTLLAQGFKEGKYFWPRPSAVDYDGKASGGSNFGPTSQALLDAVQARQAQGLSGDLLYASGSGLDPEISPGSAYAQINRVASARGLPVEKIQALVKSLVQERQWGFLGEPRVNVLTLNLTLDQKSAAADLK